MAYSTSADLLDQLPEPELVGLTDDDNDGVADAAIVARAIADADAVIDGYLGGRYAVPLDPVPIIIRLCSVDIAIYNLVSRRSRIEDIRSERYKARLAYLASVAKGDITLGVDDPAGTGGSVDLAEVSDDNPPRVFGRGNTGGL